MGGRNIDEFIRRVMSFVMKNDLAKHFSVYGRHGKRAFGSAVLFTIIYRTLQWFAL